MAFTAKSYSTVSSPGLAGRSHEEHWCLTGGSSRKKDVKKHMKRKKMDLKTSCAGFKRIRGTIGPFGPV